METQTSATGPAPLGLPPLSDFPLTESQWRTLMSIMDTVLPSVKKNTSDSLSTINLTADQYDEQLNQLRPTSNADHADTARFDQFLAETPSEMPLFQDVLRRVLSALPRDKIKPLKMILSMMGNPVTAFPITGCLTIFPELSIRDRTAALKTWTNSSIPTFRLLFAQLSVIAKHVYLRTSQHFGSVTGFPSAPPEWTPKSSYPYEFAKLDHPDAPIQLQTDVVIVGSGCGAGVVARKLAIAGHRVIVVEKGYHVPTSSLPLSETESFFHLYDQGGLVGSDDGSISVVAASCFGGGGTVNWSACLQTQHSVREEWAEKHGLDLFNSAEFQACLDRVSDHMGVSDKFIRHNHGNNTLLDGARKLGYSAKAVPQNTAGHEHFDGYCSFGCWRGEKQGPVNGWFGDAAKYGTKFIQGLKVEKIVFDQVKGKKVARGVTGIWRPKSTDGTPGGENVSRKVTIRAQRVIVSGGSIWSPALLLRSGLKNPHIGQNLRLHPTSFVAGIFEEEVKPWEGGILTSVVSSFENLDGLGHGVKLERASMMPSMSLTWLNWASGLDYKTLISKYRHMEIFIAITRDKDSGQVHIGPADEGPKINYTPSAYDRQHTMVGMLALAKILYVQGALEIHPTLPGLRPFIRPKKELTEAQGYDAGITEKSFQAWLKEMKSHGNKVPQTPFASAHQMSSCRMSAKEKDGVVDQRGKVWGCEGLYVADASVLPSASGVNPMITTMAVSDWIGNAILQDLDANKMVSGKL